MRTRVGVAVSLSVVAMVFLGSWFSPAAAAAKRYRTCVYVDRNRPAESVVVVDDFRVNDTIYDDRGFQSLWVHGPAGGFQLGFDLIRQIEVLKWMGKDPSRDDWTRYSVKVTGTADNVAYYGTIDIRVMRGLVGKAPWYYFPVTQRDRGLNLWRITFGQECVGPTIVQEDLKPPEPPIVVTAKPVEPLPPPPAPPEDEPNPGELGDVYFDFDKWDLRQASRDTLERNAEWLRRWPTARIRIEGQADPRGTNEYNFPLGLHRANAARDYLISLGIAAERLETITMGEINLVCTASTEECWQLNRRAHFILISK